jgi:lipopolysaccharide/colanic/teichoic acid biosynthesis glycosyltransferase
MKRLIDFCVSLSVLVLVTPLLLVLAATTLALLGRPVFYVQERPGLDGKLFKLIKFRTMTLDMDAEGNPLPDGSRLTRFGKFLRATSLDELPELWNVVRGEMSLVGPRPLLVEYLPLYTPEQRRRHDVRPGLTGWAQINGRNSLSWEERFELDVWYVDNQSFSLDIKIMLLTIPRVFRRSGISAVGEATMPRFTGSQASEET